MLCIKSIETEEVKLMLGVSLIIIAAAIVYMVETYISTYYTIEYMHGTSLFLILLAKYGTPVLFLLLCAYIAYRNFLKKQKAAASMFDETEYKAFCLVEAARPSATSATRWMRRSIWSPPCTMAEKQKQRKHNHSAKIYAVHLFGWAAFYFVNTAI